MNRSIQLFLVTALFMLSPLTAQELPEPRDERTTLPFFQDPSVPQPAPDYVSRSTRYESAREAIHRREAQKAARRGQRMAINMGLGYSPLRPPSSTVPVMGSPISRPVVIWVRPFVPASRFLTFVH